jgi:hypothetical protein
MSDHDGSLWKWLIRLVRGPEPAGAGERAALAARLERHYGVHAVEADVQPDARPWRDDELALLDDTLDLLGPRFYGPFLAHPLRVWLDRSHGEGGFGHGWLRIGDPGADTSVLYRVFLHEATHASNEYRDWPYEKQFCTRPGLDWRLIDGEWRHPRQQGRLPRPGPWETLPVDSRDVSTNPGEDLAEMVRYFVHSVRDERAWLWPLDQTMPATYLWETSPTRFIFVRDYFLALGADHPWYRRLDDAVEERVRRDLFG